MRSTSHLIAAKGFSDYASLFRRTCGSLRAEVALIVCYLGLMASLIALGATNSFLPVMMLSGAVGFFVLGANYALYGSAAAYYPAAYAAGDRAQPRPGEEWAPWPGR